MDDKELDLLLREHYSLVRAVCWRILRDDADADDATQNALISIARGYGRFDQRSSISTWIYRIATNAALDELRRRKRRRTVPFLESLHRDDDPADQRSIDAQAAFEVRDSLGEALDRVPEEFRIALVLRDVADLEYEDISEILGIPPGTVRSRISRGRARLADAWYDIQGNPETPGERPSSGTREMPSDPR